MTTTTRPRRRAATPTPATSPADVVKRLEKQAAQSHWEDALWQQIVACHLPLPSRNVSWHPRRRYRSEFVYTDPRDMLIIEVDGGIWLPKGGHTTGKGYERDRMRDAEAILLGYTILRFTPGMIERGEAVTYIERVLHMIWQRNASTRKAG